MKDFYEYVQNNQDVLLGLQHRGYDSPTFLGAIEGNVDKLVVHRMKSHGCCWRIQGLQAMLALCRHKEELKVHAYQYLPVSITKPPLPFNPLTDPSDQAFGNAGNRQISPACD